MYEGFIAGSHHSHHGGGYNYLCMTEHSAAPPGANTHDNNGELLYGVEYHNTGAIDKNHGHDAACAVCQHDAAPYTFTQWGRYGSCTNGFEKVYEGLIMSDWYTHYKTESICVDMERAAHAGSSSGTQSQGILYTSEMEGGSAHEEWYPHDIELGCTVCAPASDGTITSDMCVSGFFFDSTMGDCVSEADICAAVQPANSVFNTSGTVHKPVTSADDVPHTCKFECKAGYLWTGVQCIHVETMCNAVAPAMTVFDAAGGIAVTATQDQITYTCRFSSTKTGTYTRWGSRGCPAGHTKLYEGFMASGHHSDRGSGANTLCMTEHSVAPPGASTHNDNGNLLYGMEYENTGAIDKNHDQDAHALCVLHLRKATSTLSGVGTAAARLLAT
jgi:hypothetical protein